MSAPAAARPGQVRIDGLYEGPTGSWSPSADGLADALRRAGAPETCLTVVVDGGRASLEPAPGWFPRAQFASDPGESLAMALELLLSESQGGRPQEWFSTLRVEDYRDDQIRESLVQVTAEGVRVVTRESKWSPEPEEGWMRRVRRQWLAALLILVAAGAFAVKERDQIARHWHSLRGLLAGRAVEIPEGFQAEAGAFGEWIRFAEVEVDGEILVVTLAATEAFPAEAAAVDALRQGADLERRAALNALETGRARLRLELSAGPPILDQEVDLAPLRRGEVVRLRVQVAAAAGARLVALRLIP